MPLERNAIDSIAFFSQCRNPVKRWALNRIEMSKYGKKRNQE